MTSVHSRAEITELRSSWEQLLCPSNAEPKSAMGPRYELVGEPRRALGLACNDNLVGRERRQGVRNRLQRIGITDVTLCVDSGAFETIKPRG